MRATSARAKKVRQAVRTWRILMAIGLGALIVFLLACLATMGFLHYQASNRGKKLEQAELNKNVIVADSFTWAVGCLSAPADNHCSDEDVTKAGNDLNSLAPHVTLDVEGARQSLVPGTLPAALAAAPVSMPTAWTQTDTGVTATLDKTRWDLTIANAQVTTVTIIREGQK